MNARYTTAGVAVPKGTPQEILFYKYFVKERLIEMKKVSCLMAAAIGDGGAISAAFKEYKEIGLTNLDSMRGGLMVGSLIFILGFTWLVTRFTNSKFLFIHYEYMITLLILFGLIGSLETTRRFIGSLMNRLIEILNSIFDKDY